MLCFGGGGIHGPIVPDLDQVLGPALPAVRILTDHPGEQLGKVDPLPAEVAGLDLGTAGEPVGENGDGWVRVPDRRPQP
jgi:hypothetical protein